MRFKYGLDISEHKEHIFSKQAAWDALMKSKFKDFIILRAGFGVSGEEDSCFLDFYHRAKENGFTDISAYWFMYGETPEEAEKEAYNFIRIVEKHGMLLNAMILDFEDNDKWRRHGIQIDYNFTNKMIEAFIGVLRKEKLNSALYASQSVLEDFVDWKTVRDMGFGVWNARYGGEDDIKGWLWQYSDNEYINPNSPWGPLDANVMYVPDVYQTIPLKSNITKTSNEFHFKEQATEMLKKQIEKIKNN